MTSLSRPLQQPEHCRETNSGSSTASHGPGGTELRRAESGVPVGPGNLRVGNAIVYVTVRTDSCTQLQ